MDEKDQDKRKRRKRGKRLKPKRGWVPPAQRATAEVVPVTAESVPIPEPDPVEPVTMEAVEPVVAPLAEPEEKVDKRKIRSKYANDAEAYEAAKAHARASSARRAMAGKEIGQLPEPKDPARRESCRLNLLLFLQTYLLAMFPLPFSDDHLRAIAVIERSILEGGRFSLALPRGSGKSTITLGAVMWAMAYGHKRLIVLACATMSLARDSLDDFTRIVEGSKVLHADFPEIWVPISHILGSPAKANSQMHLGKRTRIKWSDKSVVFPTIAGAASSGAALYPLGLNTSIRGKKKATDEGSMSRVDMVVVDDPSTRQSAYLPSQNDIREELIESTLALLSGPGKPMAMLMCCTVIADNDVASRFLDSDRHPDWRGFRMGAMKVMPSEEAMKYWTKYRDLRKKSLQEVGDISLATQFYIENQAAMSEQAEVYWSHRIEPPCVDALQSFMDQWAKNENAFWCELQNQPQLKKNTSRMEPDARVIIRRSVSIPRYMVPNWATKIIAAIDVQQTSLWYLLTAFDNEAKPHIIDWGVYPSQNRHYVTKANIAITLQQAMDAPTEVVAWDKGLRSLCSSLLESKHRDQSGVDRTIDLVLIDANWAASSDVVYQVCRQLGGGRLMPIHGMARKAKQRGVETFRIEPNAKRGPGWYSAYGQRNQLHLQCDTNLIKSWIYNQMTASVGGLSIPTGTVADLQLLTDHLSSEYGVPMQNMETRRVVVEWDRHVGRDNEFWDCLVYSAVGASYCGVLLPGQETQVVKSVTYVSGAELQRQNRLQRQQQFTSSWRR